MQQQAQSHSKPQSEGVNMMTLASLYSIFGANLNLCIPNATKGLQDLSQRILN